MANITFANNAVTTLAGAISNVSTTCNVAAGSGVLFPPVTTASGNYFCLTFTDAATGLLREITHVTNVSGDVFTIVRGQESTAALNWLAGDLADNFWTAGSIDAVIASTQQFLTANLTVYVATTGSDSTGNGTLGNPWATIQHAYNYVTQYYNLAGFSVTVEVANGTYTQGLNILSPTIGGNINFVGDPGAPDNVPISVTNGNCFESGIASNTGGAITVNGFKLTATGSIGAGTGYGMISGSGGVIGFQNIDFNACASAHMSTGANGLIYAVGGYAISGSAEFHWLTTNSGGVIEVVGQTITISGTPAFGAFADAENAGNIICGGNTFVGSATGSRYAVSANGVINSNASTLPGSTAGTSASGGQYL